MSTKKRWAGNRVVCTSCGETCRKIKSSVRKGKWNERQKKFHIWKRSKYKCPKCEDKKKSIG